MHWGRLQPVLTGQVSHAEWMTSVADALTESVGRPGAGPRRGGRSGSATGARSTRRCSASSARCGPPGVRVGLATNATDLLDADLAALGLTGEFDVVVNSSVIGVHKPAQEYFQRRLRGAGDPAGPGALRRRRGPGRARAPGRPGCRRTAGAAGRPALPAGGAGV